TVSGVFWLAKQSAKAIAAFLGDDWRAPVPRLPLGRATIAVLVVVAVFAAGDLFFYFGAYRDGYRFGDRNTEIAYQIGQYLDSLEGDWQAHFHGPPSMYVTFPTITFLAERFTPGQNLFDVEESGPPAPVPPVNSNLVF